MGNAELQPQDLVEALYYLGPLILGLGVIIWASGRRMLSQATGRYRKPPSELAVELASAYVDGLEGKDVLI